MKIKSDEIDDELKSKENPMDNPRIIFVAILLLGFGVISNLIDKNHTTFSNIALGCFIFSLLILVYKFIDALIEEIENKD